MHCKDSISWSTVVHYVRQWGITSNRIDRSPATASPTFTLTCAAVVVVVHIARDQSPRSGVSPPNDRLPLFSCKSRRARLLLSQSLTDMSGAKWAIDFAKGEKKNAIGNKKHFARMEMSRWKHIMCAPRLLKPCQVIGKVEDAMLPLPLFEHCTSDVMANLADRSPNRTAL